MFNGVDVDVPVTDTPLGDAIIESETAFGAYDYVENRPYSGQRRFASTYDLRDYPEESYPGMWDEALEEPYDFCLCRVSSLRTETVLNVVSGFRWPIWHPRKASPAILKIWPIAYRK
ncbi:hypothetical protein MJL28_23360 [Salmonella enterica subsp. enterica serovar Kentucky]|nr:hypothetical protein [Salmonella enterica subsp. enterica serovar Kentucky]